MNKNRKVLRVGFLINTHQHASQFRNFPKENLLHLLSFLICSAFFRAWGQVRMLLISIKFRDEIEKLITIYLAEY